jgi:hypothetical protein
LLALGADLPGVSQAPTTTVRDSNELLRALFEKVIVVTNKDEYHSPYGPPAPDIAPQTV